MGKLSLPKNKAFTLTEAVITVTVLLLVWVSVVNMLVISRASEARAKHKIQAIYVLQRALDDLQKKPFASIVNSTSTVTLDTRGTPDIYTDDLTGTQVVTVSSFPYYKKAVASLTWNEILWGRTKTLTEYCGTHIANDPQAN